MNRSLGRYFAAMKDDQPGAAVPQWRVKISSTGWLCVLDHGLWCPVFKLTEEQQRELRALAEADPATRSAPQLAGESDSGH